jgi:hypothetical protein
MEIPKEVFEAGKKYFSERKELEILKAKRKKLESTLNDTCIKIRHIEDESDSYYEFEEMVMDWFISAYMPEKRSE